jgi:hypothetical protein
MNRVIGKVQAGLEERLKEMKEWLAKKLEKKHWQPIGAWGFVGVSSGKGSGNFIKGDGGGRKFFSRVLNMLDV